MSRVFVAGATGVIGRRAVARLVAAGHGGDLVARSPEKAEQLRALGAEPARVSLFDREALNAAVAGHDVVVNLATHIPPMSQSARPGAWAENDRIRTEGSANLVDAALAAGASRYVQESIVFTYPDSGERWIDAETTPIESARFTASVEAAEASAARFTEAGGVGVVLRFGMFYAPDSSHTRAQLAAARRGVSIVAGRPDAYQSTIHADDAAEAVVAALSAPAGVWDVVDDEPLTKREVGKVLGGRVRLPGRLASLAGSYGDVMVRSQRVSNRRFKEATGWAPRHRSLREGLAAVRQELDRPPPPAGVAERLVRPVLLLFAALTLLLGLWAAIGPRSFYEDFPPGSSTWVAVDGPYNEHLVRDFGQLNLALGAVFVAALVRPQPFLVRTAAFAYLLFAVPHLTYHVGNLDVYDTGDKIANVVTLALAVLGPAILVLGTARRSGGAAPRSATGVLERTSTRTSWHTSP
jgi:nucleoside-diphosphate-sugar epimerase